MKKYWYRTEVTECVICGKETKSKYRVYDEKLKGIYYKLNGCQTHFI